MGCENRRRKSPPVHWCRRKGSGRSVKTDNAIHDPANLQQVVDSQEDDRHQNQPYDCQTVRHAASKGGTRCQDLEGPANPNTGPSDAKFHSPALLLEYRARHSVTQLPGTRPATRTRPRERLIALNNIRSAARTTRNNFLYCLCLAKKKTLPLGLLPKGRVKKLIGLYLPSRPAQRRSILI